MEDLVLLRELIKTAARGHIVDLNVLFRHLNFDALFECVLARAVSPPSAAAVARAFHFLGVHTAAACSQSATELAEFTRWYSRRFYASLRLDARPSNRFTGKWETSTRSREQSSVLSVRTARGSRPTMPHDPYQWFMAIE